MVHDDEPVGLDGLQVVFDDERVVSDAGIVLVATLAGRLGIERLAGRLVRLRRDRRGAANVGRKLMALIYVSFFLRKRIGPRNWRRLHWATYLVFLLATVHGFASGTDSTQPWAHDLYLGAVGAVAFATAWRALGRPTRPAPERSL